MPTPIADAQSGMGCWKKWREKEREIVHVADADDEDDDA